VEAYLQAVAHKLYRHVDVTSRHQELVDRAWELLSAPSNIPEQVCLPTEALNFFEVSPAFFATWIQAIRKVRDLLSSVLGEVDHVPKISLGQSNRVMPILHSRSSVACAVTLLGRPRSKSPLRRPDRHGLG
jgi:hypothetical protein